MMGFSFLELILVVLFFFNIPYIIFYKFFKNSLVQDKISFSDYKIYGTKIIGIYLFVVFTIVNAHHFAIIFTYYLSVNKPLFFQEIFFFLFTFFIMLGLEMLSIFLTFKVLRINDKEKFLQKSNRLLAKLNFQHSFLYQN